MSVIIPIVTPQPHATGNPVADGIIIALGAATIILYARAIWEMR